VARNVTRVRYAGAISVMRPVASRPRGEGRRYAFFISTMDGIIALHTQVQVIEDPVSILCATAPTERGIARLR
jgi:hypothetical protein